MTQFDLGFRSIFEAVNTGGSALTTLQGLGHCAQQNSTVDIFSGAVSAIVGTFQGIKERGLALPDFKDQRLNKFMALPPAAMSATLAANLNLRHPDAGQQVGALACAIDQHRGKISVQEQPDAAAQPAEPARLPGPLEVVIVGMVTRETTSEILRDSKGQIRTTVQTERDA